MDGWRNGWVNVCDPVMNLTKYDYIISIFIFLFFLHFFVAFVNTYCKILELKQTNNYVRAIFSGYMLKI